MSNPLRVNADLTAASLDLHRQIVDRFGSHPDVLDGLKVQAFPCPHEGSGLQGHVLIAVPVGETASSENALCAYYGDEPEVAR